MRKEIRYQTQGRQEKVGTVNIFRLLSNAFVDHVGHFVFLDYFPPFKLTSRQLNPDFAHPHRGIATLTYLLSGTVEHFDSRGHQGKVNSGGVQWMKAGNGIIHNEAFDFDAENGPNVHGFQFWINLPAQNKQENPDYMSLQSNELPIIALENQAGTLKVIVGEWNGQTSKIPIYARQFLYHIRMAPGKKFTLDVEESDEYAIFLPQEELIINEIQVQAGDMVGFETSGNFIELENPSETEIDCIVFGGEKFTEPYIAYGPFVMTTKEEIRQAYTDYHKGKYGTVSYSS